jgi:hypothetical protein
MGFLEMLGQFVFAREAIQFKPRIPIILAGNTQFASERAPLTIEVTLNPLERRRVTYLGKSHKSAR